MTPVQALQAAFTDQKNRDLARLSYWWNGCDSGRISCVFWRSRFDSVSEELHRRPA